MYSICTFIKVFDDILKMTKIRYLSQYIYIYEQYDNINVIEVNKNINYHIMKRKLILMVATIAMSCHFCIAQNYRAEGIHTDGFLSSDNRAKAETKDSWGVMPSSAIDSKDIVRAPIGSGIALLAGMGIAYCVIKKKSQKSMS